MTYKDVKKHDHNTELILCGYRLGKLDGINELAEELRPLIAGYFPDMDLRWELDQAVKKLKEGLHETNL